VVDRFLLKSLFAVCRKTRVKKPVETCSQRVIKNSEKHGATSKRTQCPAFSSPRFFATMLVFRRSFFWPLPLLDVKCWVLTPKNLSTWYLSFKSWPSVGLGLRQNSLAKKATNSPSCSCSSSGRSFASRGICANRPRFLLLGRWSRGGNGRNTIAIQSTYAKLLPENTPDTASYFSFYDVMDKISTVVGTFTFGFVEQITGGYAQQRNGLGSVFCD
jgi:hypothetical protein